MKKILSIALLSSVFCGYANSGFDAEKIKDYVFLDLRSLEEASVEHLDSTTFVPSCILPYDENFKNKTDLLKAYKDKTLLLFCRSGRRAELAKDILEKAGFENVENLKTLADAREFEGKIRNCLYASTNEELLEGIAIEEKTFGIDVITPLKAKDYKKLSDIIWENICVAKLSDTQKNSARNLLSKLCYYVGKNYLSSYYLERNLEHRYAASSFFPLDMTKFKGVNNRPNPNLLSPEDRKVYDEEYELYKQFQAEMKETQDAQSFVLNTNKCLMKIVRAR